MIALLLLGCPGSTTPDDTDRQVESVDDVVAPIRDQHAVPALGAARVDGEGLLAVGVAGVRIDGQPSEVTSEDDFHLGSDTKAMTATLAAILVEEGVLAWDTTLAEAFPHLTVHADLADVTLEQLLTHSGGLSGDLAVDHPSLWQGLWDRTDAVVARAWLAEQLLALPPDGTPGTHLYSNAGFILAGAAMEVATGESWEDLLTERVFTPLGMGGCGFGAPLGDQPWGHRVDGASLVPLDPTVLGADNPVGLGPAGTVHCPLADWAAFVGLHLRGGRGEDTEILEAASFAAMHAAHAGGAAMGWYVTTRPWAEGTVLTHDGSNTAWYATAWLDPEGDRAYLGVSNVAGSRGPGATDAAVAALLE
jgi:CubicO group peptidase (beta-lactamase class C family)